MSEAQLAVEPTTARIVGGLRSDRFKIVSVDDHVLEHPTVWTDRMSGVQWGDRIPHLEHRHDTGVDGGADVWVIDGIPRPLADVAKTGALQSDRAVGPRHWEEVDIYAWDARARLGAMELDGVVRSVLYPIVAGIAGQGFAGIEDVELERACCAAYNDYLIDEWSAVSERYVPQCIVPLGDVAVAVAEIRRSAARGHKGIVMVGNPSLIRAQLPHVNEQHWDPIWAVAQELDLPVCFHSGSSPKIQMPPYVDFAPPIAAALEAMTRPVSSTFLLANLLFSGILVRFPTMKVVFTETTLAWAAYTLESAEHQFGRQRYDMAGWNVRPLEEFRRQIYLTGSYVKTGLDTRYHIGVKNMLWSTNFPQATSSWPESRHAVERCFAGVPPDETSDILMNNASALYGLDEVSS